MNREDYNKLADALLTGETTIDAEFRKDSDLPSRRGVHNETLLHFFAVEARQDLVQSLARIGAQVDVENEFGNTPLMESIIKKDLAMASLLLSLGANPNYQSSSHGNTALHVAAEYKRQEAVDLLMHAGASLRVRNNYLETPKEIIRKYGLKP